MSITVPSNYEWNFQLLIGKEFFLFAPVIKLNRFNIPKKSVLVATAVALYLFNMKGEVRRCISYEQLRGIIKCQHALGILAELPEHDMHLKLKSNQDADNVMIKIEGLYKDHMNKEVGLKIIDDLEKIPSHWLNLYKNPRWMYYIEYLLRSLIIILKIQKVMQVVKKIITTHL